MYTVTSELVHIQQGNKLYVTRYLLLCCYVREYSIEEKGKTSWLKLNINLMEAFLCFYCQRVLKAICFSNKRNM